MSPAQLETLLGPLVLGLLAKRGGQTRPDRRATCTPAGVAPGLPPRPEHGESGGGVDGDPTACPPRRTRRGGRRPPVGPLRRKLGAAAGRDADGQPRRKGWGPGVCPQAMTGSRRKEVLLRARALPAVGSIVRTAGAGRQCPGGRSAQMEAGLPSPSALDG